VLGERGQETEVIVSEALSVQCSCYDSERYTWSHRGLNNCSSVHP